MKWLVVVFLMCLARFGEGGALPPAPAPVAEDATYTTEGTKEQLNTAPSADESQKGNEVECLTGSEWESNCHSCKCSDGGVAICVKKPTCDGEYVEPIKCKPNSTFARDCNTCVCTNNGIGLCTVKSCWTVTNLKKSELKPGKECAPGTYWKSQCNECGCSPNGHTFCTEKACPGQEYEPTMRCAPDTIWNKECNTCWCTSDGLPMCTKMGCAEVTDIFEESSQNDALPEPNTSLSRKTRGVGSEPPPKNCQPGQEFRLDCNKCLCDNEGRDFSCTRHDCNALNNGGRKRRDTSEQVASECVPGSVFDKDCNVCRCTSDGHHAMCTMKRCNAEKEIKAEVTTPQPDTDPNFRCNPGEQFKRGCNDCSCSADGKSVFCTVRYCDQDITVPPSH